MMRGMRQVIAYNSTSSKLYYTTTDDDGMVVQPEFPPLLTLYDPDGDELISNSVMTATPVSREGYLSYDTQTAEFGVGEIVTGGTSGAKGVVRWQRKVGTSGTLYIGDIDGAYQDDETINDTGSGYAAVNGVLFSGEYYYTVDTSNTATYDHGTNYFAEVSYRISDTNMVANPEALGSWTATNIVVIGNGEYNPLTRQKTAEVLNEYTATGEHNVYSANMAMVAGREYRAAIVVKKEGRSWICILATGVLTGSHYAYFNIGTPAVGTESTGVDASIVDMGDDWCICMIDWEQQYSENMKVQLSIAEANGDLSFAGTSVDSIDACNARVFDVTLSTDHKRLVYFDVAAYPMAFPVVTCQDIDREQPTWAAAKPESWQDWTPAIQASHADLVRRIHAAGEVAAGYVAREEEMYRILMAMAKARIAEACGFPAEQIKYWMEQSANAWAARGEMTYDDDSDSEVDAGKRIINPRFTR